MASEVIKQRNPDMLSVAVEPAESPVITQTRNGEEIKPGPHKIQGYWSGFCSKNLNLDIVDEVELVSSEEAFDMARKVSLEEGVLAGISTGATITAALRIASRPEMAGKNIVAIGASCRGKIFVHTPCCKGSRGSYGCGRRRSLIFSVLFSGSIPPRTDNT